MWHDPVSAWSDKKERWTLTTRQAWADDMSTIVQNVQKLLNSDLLKLYLESSWEMHSNMYNMPSIGLVICEIGFEMSDFCGKSYRAW